jgi:hypothetical protein
MGVVVVGGAVGHLDRQAARVADQQRQQVVAGDQVGVDRQPEQVQPVVQVVLPHRRVPLVQRLAAPHVVDQHVEPPLLAVDPLGQRLDLGRIQVVHPHRDAGAAGPRDQLGRLLDRLGPVQLRATLTRRSAGAVHGRADRAQLDRYSSSRSAGRARHQSNHGDMLARKEDISCHVFRRSPVISR